LINHATPSSSNRPQTTHPTPRTTSTPVDGAWLAATSAVDVSMKSIDGLPSRHEQHAPARYRL
jgi:hypothetical protein